MFFYFAYGLGIKSELEILEFIPTRQQAHDLVINLDKDARLHDYLAQEIVDKPWWLKITQEEAMVYVKETGLFLVEDDRIVVIPAPNASLAALRYYIVGTVMAIVLYQRGFLVLHASVVNINGGAVGFLGVSGQGKSSTAAAFNAQGYNILTDDVAPVTLSENPATITPGFPQIKLGREIAAALGHDFDSLVSLHPSEHKRGFRFVEKFLKTPLPIRRLYTLADDTEFGIEVLKPQEAVMELVRHSRPTTLYHSGGAPHFLQCTTLIKECTVYRLKRPRNLALLPELVHLVEEHLAEDIQKVIVASKLA